jgi:predicted MFS family arabinose efflux permease
MQSRPFTGRVGYILILGISVKFFVDISVQLFNPFLVMYAAGIGVSAITMGRLVSVRNLSGLMAPLIGSLADRYGYRLIMRFNLFVAGAGVFLFATGAGIPVLVTAMIIWGIGQGGFTPNMHSYLSAMLPYSRRSRYIGTLEYSWALSGIVGLFLFGLVFEHYGWRATLYILGGGMMLSALVMGTLPKNGRHSGPHENEPSEPPELSKPGSPKAGASGRIRDFFDLGKHKRSAWSCILISVFNFFAITHIMIIHGGWLEAEYAFGPSKLGLVALLMGLFDWAGSILVSTAGDRIGKKRSVFIGITGMIACFILLPFMDTGVYPAVAGLLLPRFFFEFATVSNFPLISEQNPGQRGKILSFSVAGGLLGTTVAANTGPAAYLQFGVWGLGPVSAGAVVVSLALILLFVQEEPHRTR